MGAVEGVERNPTGAVGPCMSRRPPAAAPEPAAVAPVVGGTAVAGGSAAEAADLAVVVVGAPCTGVQPATAGRLGLALLFATNAVNGWIISVKTLLLEAARTGRSTQSARCNCRRMLNSVVAF